MDLQNSSVYRGKSIEVDKDVETNFLCLQGGDGFSIYGSMHKSPSKNSVKILTDTFGEVNSWPNEDREEEDFIGVEKGENTYAPGISVCFDQPIVGLKLGIMPKDTANLSTGKSRTSVSAKRSRVPYKSMQTIRCQVEGCNLDLTSAKGYHRRHRICDSHSKSPKVIVAGAERRFCQQCSRLHNLAEFDDTKRSCRRRLSDHNARRRRRQPEALHLSSMGLPSSLFDGIAPNFQLIRTPSSLSKTTWESSCSVKMRQTGNSLIQTSGIDASAANSLFNEAQTSPRALSLLSTDTLGLIEPECISLDQLMQETVSIEQPAAMQLEPKKWPLTSAEQAPSIFPLHSMALQNADNSYFQDFR